MQKFSFVPVKVLLALRIVLKVRMNFKFWYGHKCHAYMACDIANADEEMVHFKSPHHSCDGGLIGCGKNGNDC